MIRALDPLRLPLAGSCLIEASAGTGKTWTIAALYLRLVLGHGRSRPSMPSEILVMTFTVAATRELTERIRERLVEAAGCFRGTRTIGADDSFLKALLDEYPDGAARDEAAWHLATAADAMDEASIHTIDAWAQRMLNEHAFDSGSRFDERLEPDDARLVVEASRDYWRREIYPLSSELSARVADVWRDVDALVGEIRPMLPYATPDHTGPSLAEVCGPGLLERAADLQRLKDEWIHQGHSRAMAQWIVANRKGGALIPGKFAAKNIDGWLATLDAWALDPVAPDFDLSSTARTRFTPAGIRDCCNPGRTIDVPPPFVAFETLLRDLRRLDPAPSMRHHAATHIAARIRTLKAAAGVFGFVELTERLDAALVGRNGVRLQDRIRTRYPVAMIDEFQDTSPKQYRIFDTIYRIADDDPTTTLLLIGDPKQSIYAFRGADIHSYLRARGATEPRHYRLTINYRSVEPLVAVVNRMFETGERSDEGAFRFREPDGSNPVPFVAAHARGLDPRFVRGSADRPALTVCHDPTPSGKDVARDRFAALAADHVARALDDPDTGFVDRGGERKRLRPADLAILVRDRFDARAVRRELRRRNVSSVFLSDRDSVFASEEATDVLAWLKAIADPRDARRVRLAYATASIGLSVVEMARLYDDDTNFEARVETFRGLGRCWRRQGVLPMLRRALHELDLPARWMADEAKGGERRLTNLLHLAELLQRASATLDGEEALIRWLATEIEAGPRDADELVVRLESDADLVQVVTIHKSKGLEYPVVYLPFVTAFKDADPKKTKYAVVSDASGARVLEFDVDDAVCEESVRESRREELRLFYVAATRARHALWIGVAAIKQEKGTSFNESAFGYLLSGGEKVSSSDIAPLLHRTFDGLAGVEVVQAVDSPAVRIAARDDRPPLAVVQRYDASFERDWTVASFSAVVRTLARPLPVVAMVDPAVEEELRSTDDETGPPPSPAASAARHRFPRGAIPGNFLHDQLEWLASQGFALDDPEVRAQLQRRCERQGWGHRARDVLEWMDQIVNTSLPPIGRPLAALTRILPEMEFWFPSEGCDARTVDALCTAHLFSGRARPSLPERTLHGMLMGFADLVFEADGRNWVLDYKSNALGAGDADYTADALERSMTDHRYDVQAALYLLALHRLLRARLGASYAPARHLGGALYLFLRGIEGPVAGCCVVPASADFVDALDAAFREPLAPAA